jgi:TPR repeat protein
MKRINQLIYAAFCCYSMILLLTIAGQAQVANKKHNDPCVQFNLGVMYMKGHGVEKNYKKAQHNLALMYFYGDGVIQNYAKAKELFQESANQGYAPAQYNLGLMYKNGIGINKDIDKAHDLFKMAGEQGHEKAQNQMQR